MTTIAACFMVRNDLELLNEMLPRALKSVKFLVDQIVIVHTKLPGDKPDNVRPLAQKYNADLYYHPWETDFSKHRNQTLDYSICDWNLIIDSDEELLKEDIKTKDFKIKLERLPQNVDGLSAVIGDVKKGKVRSHYNQPRLLRNHIRYTGYVHNTIGTDHVIVGSDIHMKHYGYGVSPHNMDRKYERTYSLIKKLRKERPKDPKVFYHMVQMYHAKDKINAMFHSGIKCLQLLEEAGWDKNHMSIYQSIYYYLGQTCIESNQMEVGLKFVEKGLELVPNDIDLLACLAGAGIRLEDPEMVMRGTKGYLFALKQYKESPHMYGTRTVFTGNEETRLQMIRWRRAVSTQIRDGCSPASNSLGHGG